MAADDPVAVVGAYATAGDDALAAGLRIWRAGTAPEGTRAEAPAPLQQVFVVARTRALPLEEDALPVFRDPGAGKALLEAMPFCVVTDLRPLAPGLPRGIGGHDAAWRRARR